MSNQKIAAGLSPLEQKVLPVLKEKTEFGDIVAKTGLSEVEVMRAVQWLANKNLIEIREKIITMVNLDKNGHVYKDIGLPETRFLKALDAMKSRQKVGEIAKKAGIESQEINICIGMLRKAGAINIEKEKELFVSITESGRKKKTSLIEKFLQKRFPLDPDSLADEERYAYDELLKRKEIIKKEESKARTIVLTSIGKDIQKIASNLDLHEKLTPAMIESGKWKKKEFRRYDVSINVPDISGGRVHFVDQAIRYIKRIWLDLGFKEMTGNMVQTAFWDLDALFVPQDHPAREEQDTFYLSEPRTGTLPPICKKIKEVHENGADTGSTGWKDKYSEKIAKENLLRTHTTVLSAQTIAKLKESDLPAKFFSVGRVYRNEALSWKHLFEFIQVEGIVVDPKGNFKNLKGYLKEFFMKMGFPDVRIRPGHFPYTEPSAEVDVWHPGKKMWVELGGSGIFRPELTKPLLGTEVPVLAWGIGMERSIMEYYNIKDIRDLYKNDIKQLREIKNWMK